MKNKPNKQTTDNRNLHLKFECENLEKFKKNKNENLKERKTMPTNQPTEKQIRVKRKNRTAIELNNNNNQTLRSSSHQKEWMLFRNNDDAM